MKRWALLVMFLYGLSVVVLTAPLSLAAFADSEFGLKEAFVFYQGWQYWLLVLGVMLLQAGLLFVPVKVASRRPVTKRSLIWPVATGGFLAGCLLTGLAFAVYETVAKEDTHEPILFVLMGAGVLFWILWAVLFAVMAGKQSAENLAARQVSWLMKGSILELLVAVPTHILARWRGYCCAGMLTFLGLSTGLAVMLMAFGPAVFWLFVARWKKLHPKEAAKET